MNFKQFVLLLVIALAVMGCTQPSDSPVLVAAGDPSKYPRCAGSVEPHKCEALEKKLENESPQAAANRVTKLDQERAKNMELANAAPTAEVQPAQPVVGTGWYMFDLNHSKCFPAKFSPADLIRDIQGYGVRARTSDLPNGAVEVADGSGYWTFYRSIDACIASLPRSQPVPQRYE